MYFKKFWDSYGNEFRVDPRTKIVHHVHLYNILKGRFFQCHLRANAVRVYRVTPDNFFPPKLIFKISLLFWLYSPTQDLQNKKRIIQFGSEIRKLWIFADVESENIRTTVIRYSNRVLKKKKTDSTTRVSVKNWTTYLKIDGLLFHTPFWWL